MPGTIDTTLTRFPPAAADFARHLYIEHIEEVAFLYDQRNFMLNNPGFEARDIAWNETRTDRHLDALVAGGDVALALCRTRAGSGEPGELYAALRVFCRCDRPDFVEAYLDAFDIEEVRLASAAGDGLKHGLPQHWSPDVLRWLEQSDEARTALLSIACAYRGLQVGSAIAQKALSPLSDPVPFLWALGRLAERSAIPVFERYLVVGDDESRQAAAIAAVRCGDQRTTSALRAAVSRSEPWAALPLAIVGFPEDFDALKLLARRNGPHPRVALALGLLGNTGAIQILSGWLESDDTKEAAAIGLFMLTGSCPTEPCVESPIADAATNTRVGAEEPKSLVAGSRKSWRPVCSDPGLIQGLLDLVKQSDSSAICSLASTRLPVDLSNLLGDVLAARYSVHTAPRDGWGGGGEAPSRQD